MAETGEVTRLLVAYRQGDREAFDRLVPLVYDDLRRIAHAHIRRSSGNDRRSLDTTGLVHEAYLRLVDQTQASWEDRQHLLAVCAVAMRQIVVSDARRRAAQKRGGDRQATLDEDSLSDTRDVEQILEIDQALDGLARRSERMARVVECRYFAGLGEQETADALGMSLRSVQREWMKARAWLREALLGSGAGSPLGGRRADT